MEREVAIAVGVGLMILGCGAGIMSVIVGWLPDTQSTTIEPREGWLTIEIMGRSWGHLDLSYVTEDGSSISVEILDKEQYKDNAVQSGQDVLYRHDGPSGDFSGKVDFETYYLLFERFNLSHISVSELSQPIEIAYTISVTGVNPVLLVASIAFATPGIGFLAKAVLGRP